MNNFSLTQSGNIVSLVSLLVLVADKFGLLITGDEAQVIVNGIAAILTLVGILISFYGRWRKGDLTAFGTRK